MNSTAPECICRGGPYEPEDRVWASDPDSLGCLVHRPTKQYCRVHHQSFYGTCGPCISDMASNSLADCCALLADCCQLLADQSVMMKAILYPEVKVG